MPPSPANETASKKSHTEPLIPFLAISLAAALIAAAAAQASSILAVPVWAMFVGWVVFYTRGHSTWSGIVNVICLVIGLAIGLCANFALEQALPRWGAAALPSVVLAVSFLVMSLRALPVIDNLQAYFLGLTSVFAAQTDPGVEAFMELGVASVIGGLAGWATRTSHSKLTPRQPTLH